MRECRSVKRSADVWKERFAAAKETNDLQKQRKKTKEVLFAKANVSNAAE